MAKLKGGSRVYGNLTVDGSLTVGTSGQSVLRAFDTGSGASYTPTVGMKYALVIATGGGGGGGGADCGDTTAGAGGARS